MKALNNARVLLISQAELVNQIHDTIIGYTNKPEMLLSEKAQKQFELADVVLYWRRGNQNYILKQPIQFEQICGAQQ